MSMSMHDAAAMWSVTYTQDGSQGIGVRQLVNPKPLCVVTQMQFYNSIVVQGGCASDGLQECPFSGLCQPTSQVQQPRLWQYPKATQCHKARSTTLQNVFCVQEHLVNLPTHSTETSICLATKCSKTCWLHMIH